MTGTLRGILIVCIILYYLTVFWLLKKERLMLKYSLLWIFMGIIMSVLVLFPKLLAIASNMIGIIDAMNGLFTFILGFILVILMALTSIVSKQSDRIKNLIQYHALLERRIRDLEKDEYHQKMQR